MAWKQKQNLWFLWWFIFEPNPSVLMPKYAMFWNLILNHLGSMGDSPDILTWELSRSWSPSCLAPWTRKIQILSENPLKHPVTSENIRSFRVKLTKNQTQVVLLTSVDISFRWSFLMSSSWCMFLRSTNQTPRKPWKPICRTSTGGDRTDTFPSGWEPSWHDALVKGKGPKECKECWKTENGQEDLNFMKWLRKKTPSALKVAASHAFQDVPIRRMGPSREFQNRDSGYFHSVHFQENCEIYLRCFKEPSCFQTNQIAHLVMGQNPVLHRWRPKRPWI